jgi:hypothetical protein
MVQITNKRLCDTDHTGRILQYHAIPDTQESKQLISDLLEADTSESRLDTAKETHDRTGCGGEPTTEDPVVPESNSNEPGRTVMTDGGTESIRNWHEVQYTDDRVRRYSADGSLYAYRDGDDHVIVSRGNEPRTRWTERVSADREAVLAGEHLWTIPENWNHRVKIKGAGNRRYAIYHIPQTGVDVLVTVPNKTRLVDAWYGVKRVGKLTVTYDGGVSWDNLASTIEAVRDIDRVSDDVVTALETLNRRRRSFEREFAEAVNMDAKDTLLGHGRDPVTVDQWTTDPWGGMLHIDSIVQDFLNLDDETIDAVLQHLYEGDVLPYHPTVRVDVEEGEGVPDGYEINALAEAGASNSEIIDYLATEYYDLMSQGDWAEFRGTEVSATTENVNKVKNMLSD